jgi:hypothetical protein
MRTNAGCQLASERSGSGWHGTAQQAEGPYHRLMSPTIFRSGGFSVFFYSQEERRLHVHVHHADGLVKIWIEPEIEIATVYGLNRSQISAALKLVQEHEDEIRRAWEEHFGS